MKNKKQMVTKYLTWTYNSLLSKGSEEVKTEYSSRIDGSSLDDVIALMKNIQKELPVGAQNARLSVEEESDPYSDSVYTKIYVKYDILETDEECESRLEQKKLDELNRKARLEAQFEKLKKELGK